MKKIFLLMSILCLPFSFIRAQNNLLSFDGIDDYVDLGHTVIGGVRTVELWFTPAVDITPTSLSNYSTLVARRNNTHISEWILMFDSSGAGPYAGKIVFDRNNAGSFNRIASNSNTWMAGICHHVAAVVDPVSGMKLYIDGVLQTDTNPFWSSIGISSEITAIGRYGNSAMGYFKGEIDEVRFWPDARTEAQILSSYQYSMAPGNPYLVGYWNFDEGGGTVANDLSSIDNDGVIYGATWSASGGCLVGMQDIEKENVQLNVYPNPINENSVFTIQKPAGVDYALYVNDVTGKTVVSEVALNKDEITLSSLVKLNPGVYFVNVVLNNENHTTSSMKVVVAE